ncbi:MAG: hypothetical protein IPG23_11360 [Burkholderiales bacterium]|nr:hypothetical protein [Burkholderiales bacterium]
MQIIRDLPSAATVHNPEIRQLVQQRINDLGGDSFDANELGYFLVIEPEDTLHSIAAQLGFSIVANRSTNLRYDQEGFTPSFEFVEQIGNCYDLVFVISDDGYGIEVFVPNTEGIDPDLLRMCQRYATPPFPDPAPP